ncbi:urea amidohydrolase [Rhodococcoides fascians]|nr:urea amidohydrolase [Rhodococcus sp. ANT_H53B]OZC60088.1 urea amidohydrolase [Rhodococcus sp. 06-621-2]OZE90816.1 urea amidohydrolase [Rhodococcus fascians]RMB77186.1 urea amidohydrolase [Rhodococcus sp. SBT000017]OZF09954.1 urea amidohydrolase [Rhodococcus fascians]
MTAREETEPGRERRRAALASVRLAAADVAHRDTDEVENLAAGHEIDEALAAGNTLNEVARSICYTEAVASDLLSKFQEFRDSLAARSQIPLF